MCDLRRKKGKSKQAWSINVASIKTLALWFLATTVNFLTFLKELTFYVNIAKDKSDMTEAWISIKNFTV